MPLNPFARNAAAERNKRQAERVNKRKREEMAAPKAATKTTTPSPGMSLAERQKQAAKKLQNEKIVVKEQIQEPIEIPKPTIITKVKSEDSAPKKDRREELNRKTEEARKKYQEITTQVNDAPVLEELSVLVEEVIDEPITEDLAAEIEDKASITPVSKNVFKTVSQTKKSPVSGDKRKRKRRGDKKGGGRQKMEKKLNRQRILEFKYFAREELDDPNVPEEHRSNILGQIIAKGERTSIDSAIEFIQTKQAELILTEEVANSLINEIRRISTRR